MADFANLCPRGSTNTILSVASGVNSICGSLIAELLMPKSTSSERIISTMRSARASLSPIEIPGKDLRKSAIALGSSVDEIEGRGDGDAACIFVRCRAPARNCLQIG